MRVEERRNLAREEVGRPTLARWGVSTTVHNSCPWKGPDIMQRARYFIVVVILYNIVGFLLLSTLFDASVGNSPLYNLAARGDAAGVTYLLTKGANPATPGTHTALAPALGWLLKSETPLYKACENGHKDVVSLLLKAGAAANKGMSFGLLGSIFVVRRTPLVKASEKGHKEVVDLLLEAGAAVDMGGALGPFGSIWTEAPLIAASENGHKEVVDLLLKASAAVHKGGTLGPFGSIWTATPLIAASWFGHREVVDLLLKADATADKGGTLGPFNMIWTKAPLIAASENGYKEVVDLLLKAGATALPGNSSRSEL